LLKLAVAPKPVDPLTDQSLIIGIASRHG